jgi:mannitol/fructose-specific phosphotransferase system IIA component (Ntr-type)
MQFSDFICPEAVIAELKTADRDGVIAELVHALAKAGKFENARPADITRAVVKRENEGSTGMGKGVALPHVKHKAVKRVVAGVGLKSEGIDFAALDKQPVYSVILLLSPADDPDEHLQVMEKVFKHIQQEKFRKFLRQCSTAEEILDLLQEADQDPEMR